MPVTPVSTEMPLPDFCLLDHQLVVFNYKSKRIQDLFSNSKVQWLPCEVACSYDEDVLEEIPTVEEHKSLEIAVVNPLFRCRLAPGAFIQKVGDGFWNQLEAIDNMSLYEEELEQSDVFMIEGSPMTFANVAFKKKAQALGINGIKFERISTLTQ